jgi:arylsulfatase A-like enzyme
MQKGDTFRQSRGLRWNIIAIGSLVLLASLALLRVDAADIARKPNFIVILIDDMGYRDVGAYGAKDTLTPHIDSLARRGTRFVNAYSTCAVCSPARAALLTGRYQQRYGLEWVLSPHQTTGTCRWGLDEREKTLGDLLRQQGYATAAVGKWHVGDREPFFPNNRGFDYFYGYLEAGHFYLNPDASERENPIHPWFRWAKANGGAEGARWFFDYYNAPVYRNREAVGFQGYLSEALHREALQFIQKNKDRPFFLYLAHVGLHTPIQATEKYLGRFPALDDEQFRRTYAAALSAVDDGVGEIVAKLRELDLEKNTLLFFTSDNGGPSFWKPRPEILDTVKAGTPMGAPQPGEKPDYEVVSQRFQWRIGANGSDNLPLSFGKGVLYEGGVRVPMIVQWPGVAPADKVSDAVVSHLDIVPTCVAAAGGKLPTDRQYDGADLRPYFAGQTGDWTDRPMFWRIWKDRAVRWRKWKLVWSGDAQPRLYDLAADIEEEHDLAAAHPEIVKKLQAAWNEWNKNNVAPLFQYDDLGRAWHRPD